MTNDTYNCKICGWQNLRYPHAGSVDCIQQYRLLVEELRGLLPQGKQVLLGTIDRDSTARIWIDGPITQRGLERIKEYMAFMQDAYGPDVKPGEPTATEVQ